MIQIESNLILWLNNQVLILHRCIQFTDELFKILILVKVSMDSSLFNIDVKLLNIQIINMLLVELNFMKDIT